MEGVTFTRRECPAFVKFLITYASKNTLKNVHVSWVCVTHVTYVCSSVARFLCVVNKDTCIPPGGLDIIYPAAQCCTSLIFMKDSCFVPHVPTHVPVQCAFTSNYMKQFLGLLAYDCVHAQNYLIIEVLIINHALMCQPFSFIPSTQVDIIG